MSNLNKWITREGESLNVKEMTTSHLLATIHMIERNRMNNLLQLGLSDIEVSQETVDYYVKWPSSYEALCDEAEARQLIKRGFQKQGIVKKRK